MDRKQFWVLISLVNVVFGGAVDYLDPKILNDGSGDTNISSAQTMKANIFVVSCSGCTINVNGDLADPQPLIVRPGTSAFVYPADKTGIIYLEIGQAVEIYCPAGLKVPEGVGNSAIAKCVDGNKYEVNGIPYSFKDFTCKSIPYHTARKTGSKCYNNAAQVEIGFDLGTRFLKVLEVCFNEITEETYYAKYQLMPASAGRSNFDLITANA